MPIERVYLVDIVDDKGERLYTLKRRFSNREALKIALTLILDAGEEVEIYGKREGCYIDSLEELLKK